MSSAFLPAGQTLHFPEHQSKSPNLPEDVPKDPSPKYSLHSLNFFRVLQCTYCLRPSSKTALTKKKKGRKKKKENLKSHTFGKCTPIHTATVSNY